MALVVTATGGLCLMVAMILIGQIVGSYQLDDVLAAGGRYRMRRHLLTVLGLADPLAWSGGAAVRFALLDPRTGALLDSDVVYGAGRPGRAGPGDHADVGGDTT